jgi:hypothetical protein
MCTLDYSLNDATRAEFADWLVANIQEFERVEGDFRFELPAYYACLRNDTNLTDDGEVSLLNWWLGRKGKLPTLFKLLRLLLVFQPTSATVERTFSMIGAYTSDQQWNLEDNTLLATVRARYDRSFPDQDTAGNNDDGDDNFGRLADKRLNNTHRVCFYIFNATDDTWQ